MHRATRFQEVNNLAAGMIFCYFEEYLGQDCDDLAVVLMSLMGEFGVLRVVMSHLDQIRNVPCFSNIGTNREPVDSPLDLRILLSP